MSGWSVSSRFILANRSIRGVGKWFAKFRTGKFRPGIAFTICTNQFHVPENGWQGLKLVSKMALKKWNTNFLLEYSIRKNRTTFSDVPLLSEIVRWKDPKSRVPFTFQPDFPEIFVNNQFHGPDYLEVWKRLIIKESVRTEWWLPTRASLGSSTRFPTKPSLGKPAVADPGEGPGGPHPPYF